MTCLAEFQIHVDHYRFVAGFAVPLIATSIGILAKKTGGNERWKRTHFYLGTELTLAAFAAALLNLADQLRPGAKASPSTRTILLLNLVATISSIFVLFLLISMRQDWEPRVQKKPYLSFFWLILVSDGLGFLLLAAAAILVPADGDEALMKMSANGIIEAVAALSGAGLLLAGAILMRLDLALAALIAMVIATVLQFHEAKLRRTASETAPAVKESEHAATLQ